MGLLWPKCRTQPLAFLNLIQFALAHRSSLSRSLCRAFLHSSRLTLPPNLVSSADLLREHSIPSSRSLIKMFSAKLLSSWVVPSLYWCLGLFLSSCKALHFSLLNCVSFLLARFSSLSWSLWMASWPSGISSTLPSLVSPANLLRVHSAPSSRSVRKMLNRIGLQKSHEVLHLGWDNPMQKYRLGGNCLGNRSTEMDLVGLTDSKLNKSHQHTLTATMTNHILLCIK